MPNLTGMRAATCAAGIKYCDRKDLLLVVFDHFAPVAGVFTRSKCPSAAVDWCRQHLHLGKIRGLVINSGNANAFTGIRGAQAARETALAAAAALNCPLEAIMLASTGVIGEPMDTSSFATLLHDLAARAGNVDWLDMARTIMTTDTFPKCASRTVEIAGKSYVINGFAKGSGMIAPDMATMLGFIFTDAPVDAATMQAMLDELTPATFNAITVDGDTSTSDTVLMVSLGTEDASCLSNAQLPPLKAALYEVMRELAQLIVRDGEGASKFITVHVYGGINDMSAKRLALSVANSPLVKTAIAGGDANWGRIVMAVGKAGEPADRDRLGIRFGNLDAAMAGERHPDYDEDMLSEYMRGNEITIAIDIGLGDGQATIWTCDLTQDYISINADYRS